MRKVYLDKLPKSSSAKYIKWKDSIGLDVDFIYDDISGNIKITNYNEKTKTIYTLYNDFNSNIKVKNFVAGNLKKILGKNDFKYEIDEIIKDKNGKTKKIVKRFRKNGTGVKLYECLCLNCNHTFTVDESRIDRGIGCGICNNSIIVPGYNDLGTTHPDFIKYFANKDDMKKYSHGSHKKILARCPTCGFEKNMPIYSLINDGFSCPKCSDGISYPNRVIANVLKSMNIQFTTEYSPEWAYGKRYDFLFNLNNELYILEAHGKQHYCGGFEAINGKTLEEEISNDKYKKQIAIKNGFDIQHYIVVDCRKSTIAYIKNSLINTVIYDTKEFELIDWRKIDKDSRNSLIYDICTFYTKQSKDFTKISDYFNVSSSTVNRYLKIGSDLGFCKFNPKEHQQNILKKNHKKNRKPILITKDKVEIGEFESGVFIEKISKDLFGIQLLSPQISKSARTGNPYKGYNFTYV